MTPPFPAGGPRVAQSVGDGFRWGSAAIGAGTAAALVLLIFVGGTSSRHRHEHVGIAQ